MEPLSSYLMLEQILGQLGWLNISRVIESNHGYS